LCEGKSLEDKWAALKTYRRAMGLCIKCAENGAESIGVLLQSNCMLSRKYCNYSTLRMKRTLYLYLPSLNCF
jgi:hypothetical protein